MLQIIAAQTDYEAATFEEKKLQVILEETQRPVAESLVELLHSLEERPKFVGLHSRTNQRCNASVMRGGAQVSALFSVCPY